MMPVVQFAKPDYFMIGTEIHKLELQGTDVIHVGNCPLPDFIRKEAVSQFV